MFALVIDKLRKMLWQMKRFALFIWIRAVLDRTGRDREENSSAYLEEEMNIEFGISVVSKVLVPRSGPVISKARQTLLRF